MSEATNEPGRAAEHLARNLFLLRTARAMTQDDLAAKAGVSRNHYRLLEAGRASSGQEANPRLTTVEALAKALEVGLEDLLLEPVVCTLLRWADAEVELEKRQEAVLLDRLMVFSTRYLGDDAAARVSPDGLAITMGVALPASSERAALILSGTVYQEALKRAGVRAVLTDEVEMNEGTDGLVGAES